MMTEFASEIQNDKNKKDVRCQFCRSLILKPATAKYLEEHTDIDLPLMQQKHTKDQHTVETEPLRHFWVVDDMFIFENIGFSNTVENRKYLTCADCDMGPVGYHDIGSKKCYIALKRIQHGGSPSPSQANCISENGTNDTSNTQNN